MIARHLPRILVWGPAAAALLWSADACAAQPAGTVDELVVTAPTIISELTVTAAAKCLEPERMGRSPDRPRVVSTFPARDATVRPGLVIVRVTFDKPMACYGALAAAPPLSNPCPGSPQQMLLSYDRRTVRTACVVAPGVSYGLSLNRDLDRGAFMGLGGLPAETHRLSFETSSEPPVASVCEALAQDPETVRQLAERGRKLDCAAPGS